MRYQLAVEAFCHTAEYDALISGWLYQQSAEAPRFAPTLVLPFTKVQDLRYGENPRQQAAFYREPQAAAGTIAYAEQLQGKELSFNNLNDLNAAWEMVQEFEEPAAVALSMPTPVVLPWAGHLHSMSVPMRQIPFPFSAALWL